MRRRDFPLCYITHIDNVPSILTHGILSHESISNEGLPYTPIYDKAIISERHKITTPDGKTLNGYANLFFQPSNAMLYRVLCERSKEEIVVIAVSRKAMECPGTFISDGNAASSRV